MAALSTISLKRGDTLSFAGYLPVNALPPGNWSAACSVIHKTSLARRTIAAALTPPAGEELRYMLTLYAPASEVAQWELGKYIGDVEFTDASAQPEPFKVSSDDFSLVLAEDRTV